LNQLPFSVDELRAIRCKVVASSEFFSERIHRVDL
jgi:hypothetical protein